VAAAFEVERGLVPAPPGVGIPVRGIPLGLPGVAMFVYRRAEIVPTGRVSTTGKGALWASALSTGGSSVE
jgi:hypothetical protein